MQSIDCFQYIYIQSQLFLVRLDETIIINKGTPTHDNRIDCRIYECTASSIKLYLVQCGTILDDPCKITKQWLKEITKNQTIDWIIVSAACSDLSRYKFE